MDHSSCGYFLGSSAGASVRFMADIEKSLPCRLKREIKMIGTKVG